MEICSICNRELDSMDTVVFIGYSLCQGDRTLNPDTIVCHSECCDQNLVRLLEEKLLT